VSSSCAIRSATVRAAIRRCFGVAASRQAHPTHRPPIPHPFRI
jgi:hypothetical protein